MPKLHLHITLNVKMRSLQGCSVNTPSSSPRLDFRSRRSIDSLVAYSVTIRLGRCVEMGNRGLCSGEVCDCTQNAHLYVLHSRWRGRCIDIARQLIARGTYADSLIRRSALSLSAKARKRVDNCPQGEQSSVDNRALKSHELE